MAKRGTLSLEVLLECPMALEAMRQRMKQLERFTFAHIAEIVAISVGNLHHQNQKHIKMCLDFMVHIPIEIKSRLTEHADRLLAYVMKLVLEDGRYILRNALIVFREMYFITSNKLFVHLDSMPNFLEKLITLGPTMAIDDFLEEIVCEIDDETDKAELCVREIGEDTYIVLGTMTLNDFND